MQDGVMPGVMQGTSLETTQPDRKPYLPGAIGRLEGVCEEIEGIVCEIHDRLRLGFLNKDIEPCGKPGVAPLQGLIMERGGSINMVATRLNGILGMLQEIRDAVGEI